MRPIVMNILPIVMMIMIPLFLRHALEMLPLAGRTLLRHARVVEVSEDA